MLFNIFDSLILSRNEDVNPHFRALCESHEIISVLQCLAHNQLLNKCWVLVVEGALVAGVVIEAGWRVCRNKLLFLQLFKSLKLFQNEN